ncbi:hypothetical protein WAB73_003343 [Salmonella enterica subsp. enterica]
MGRSTKMIIRGREFASRKAAVDYFMEQRSAVKESGPLREGELFEEIRDLYTRYCEITKWDLSNRVIHAFSVDYEPRKNGQTWASHLCYWVHFSPKDRLSFSVRKAVDEVARAATAEQQK